jgi:hypothetical protein
MKNKITVRELLTEEEMEEIKGTVEPSLLVRNLQLWQLDRICLLVLSDTTLPKRGNLIAIAFSLLVERARKQNKTIF